MRPHRWQPTRLPHPWDSPGKNTGVGCHFLLQCMKGKSESEVAQSYPTLSDPMDCNPSGSSVHGISQARVLDWGAIAFSIMKYQTPDHGISCLTTTTTTTTKQKRLLACRKNKNKTILFNISRYLSIWFCLPSFYFSLFVSMLVTGSLRKAF